MRAVITSSPPAWTSSAGMLSTPADFPFFNDCTAASTFQRRMGWSSSVSAWVQFSTDGSPLTLWLYSSEQYSVHRFSICRFSVRHSPERSWTVVAFPCYAIAIEGTQPLHSSICRKHRGSSPWSLRSRNGVPCRQTRINRVDQLLLLFASTTTHCIIRGCRLMDS